MAEGFRFAIVMVLVPVEPPTSEALSAATALGVSRFLGRLPPLKVFFDLAIWLRVP